MKATPQDVADALALLGLNADKIFDRIRGDLNRGLISDARTHLNFVDLMMMHCQTKDAANENETNDNDICGGCCS